MKYLLLFLVIILSININAQCPTGIISISNQSDVDNFSTNYPGCTSPDGLRIFYAHNLNGLIDIDSIKGSFGLEISTNVLSNLSGLSNLKYIESDLEIADCNDLLNVDGLSSLNYVGGDVKFIGNEMLDHIDDLSALDTIGGNLELSDLPITSISGLSGVKSIGHLETSHNAENIDIFLCNELTNLSGIQSIDYINYIKLRVMDALVDVSALGNISRINRLNINDVSGLEDITAEIDTLGILDLGHLNSLKDISGFNNLDSIYRINIYDMDSLLEITGFNSANSDYGTIIFMRGAPSLTNISGFDNMASKLGSFSLRDMNLLSSIPSLNSVDSVASFELVSLNNLQAINSLQNASFINAIKVQMTGISEISNFNNLDSIGLLQLISCNNLVKVTGFQNVKSTGTFKFLGNQNLSTLPSVPNISSLSELAIVNSDLVTLPSSSFSDLRGVGILNISNNPKLINLNDFDQLEVIAIDFIISGNDLFDDISFLSNVRMISSPSIYDNPMLTECCVLSNIISEGKVLGTLDINNNGFGCANVVEMFDACPDADLDGFVDSVDNCPEDINIDQSDQDSDGIGDGCDNCPTISNADQNDANGNGVGDACESLTNTNQSIELESGAVIVSDKNFGIILKSPNGNCFNLKISNNGTVETFAVNCPN